MASLLFFVHHMGENDWKSVVLEEPGDYSVKRTLRQIAEKWREVKYLRRNELLSQESRSFEESEWFLKNIAALLRDQQSI